jgi:hypothetical protein
MPSLHSRARNTGGEIVNESSPLFRLIFCLAFPAELYWIVRLILGM